VQFYSSEESSKQVQKIQQILNLLGEEENEKSEETMKNHFITACKYEYLFWEMVFNL
jgi:thiaminase (transcriptional activator TenA)